jgi:thiol-disulfide isomerase/thioredoxin
MTTKRFMPLVMMLILCVTAFMLCGCGESESTEKSPEGEATAQKQSGSTPGLANERFVLTDLAGKERTWSEFAGKPLIINFWATWCGPCRVEMPAMMKKRAVAPFIDKMQVPWVIVYGDQQVAYEFKLGRGVPMTIFFDGEGKETGRVTGARPESFFRQEIAKLFPAKEQS